MSPASTWYLVYCMYVQRREGRRGKRKQTVNKGGCKHDDTTRREETQQKWAKIIELKRRRQTAERQSNNYEAGSHPCYIRYHMGNKKLKHPPPGRNSKLTCYITYHPGDKLTHPFRRITCKPIFSRQQEERRKNAQRRDSARSPQNCHHRCVHLRT